MTFPSNEFQKTLLGRWMRVENVQFRDSENHDLCGALYCTPSVKFFSLSRKQKMIVQQLTRKNLLSEISGCSLGYKLSNSISGLFFLVAQTQWSFFI